MALVRPCQCPIRRIPIAHSRWRLFGRANVRSAVCHRSQPMALVQPCRCPIRRMPIARSRWSDWREAIPDDRPAHTGGWPRVHGRNESTRIRSRPASDNRLHRTSISPTATAAIFQYNYTKSLQLYKINSAFPACRFGKKLPAFLPIGGKAGVISLFLQLADELAHPLQRLGDVLDRIRIGNPRKPLAAVAESIAGDDCHALLIQKPLAEFVR